MQSQKNTQQLDLFLLGTSLYNLNLVNAPPTHNTPLTYNRKGKEKKHWRNEREM